MRLKHSPKDLAKMSLRLLIYVLKFVAAATVIFYLVSAIMANNAYIFLTLFQTQAEIARTTLAIGIITLVTWTISVLSDPTLRK